MKVLSTLILGEVTQEPAAPSSGVVVYVLNNVFTVKDSNGNKTQTVVDGSGGGSSFADIWAANTLINC